MSRPADPLNSSRIYSTVSAVSCKEYFDYFEPSAITTKPKELFNSFLASEDFCCLLTMDPDQAQNYSA